jgi:hypothetical protein
MTPSAVPISTHHSDDTVKPTVAAAQHAAKNL